MVEEVCLTGKVKQNFSDAWIKKDVGFLLDRKSGNRLLKLLDRIIPKSTKIRNKFTKLPLTEKDDVSEWEKGDRVLISVKNIDRGAEVQLDENSS